MTKQENQQAKEVEAVEQCCSKDDCNCSAKPSKEVIDAIIRKRVYAAAGVGLVPIPLVDLAGLTAIQIELLKSLCEAYGIPFKEQWVKSSISALCGGGLTVALVPTISSLLKAIPVIGFTAGAATVSLTGAASTYAIGCVFNKHFSNSGTLESFNAEDSKSYFKEKYEEGKSYVSNIVSKKKDNTAKAEDAPA